LRSKQGQSVCKAKPQQTASPFQRTIKANTHLGVGFFVCYDEGREPERVAACKKQCGTLFLAARALRPKQGQAVCAAGKDGESLPAHHKNRHPKDVGFLFLYRFLSKIAKNNIKKP